MIRLVIPTVHRPVLSGEDRTPSHPCFSVNRISLDDCALSYSRFGLDFECLVFFAAEKRMCYLDQFLHRDRETLLGDEDAI